VALCQRCRPAPIVAPHSVPWRPTIARVLPGELGAILPRPRPRKDVEQLERWAAERERYRTLVAGREATVAEMPKSCVSARKQIMGAAGWRRDRLTYWLVEDTERGELVHSVALVTVVRIVSDMRLSAVLAAGFWENGAWSGGIIRTPLPFAPAALNEWITRARGEAWSPPSCLRCGRTVRMRGDGETYKHKTIEGQECA
jgi:hypothetical protein